MDIPDARSDFVRILEVHEGFEQLHVRAGGLDGDDVGIQRGDGVDDVVEFAVAHVGVDLRFIPHAAAERRKASVAQSR